jgi:hypothetical protein
LTKPTIYQQIQNQDNQIDSSGVAYSHHYTNLPLSKQFLKIEYINHAQRVTESSHSGTSINDGNKKEKSSAFSLEYSDFVLILLIGLFSLLAYIRLTGKNYFNRLLMSARNYTYSISFYRERNLAFVLYKNLLLIVFYLSAGLLGSVIVEYFKLPVFHSDRIVQFLLLTCLILVLVLINRFFIRISGFIFAKNRIASEYLFYYGNLLRLVGIGLLILNVGLFFINKEAEFVFIYIALFIGFITYFIKVVRILIIFFNNRFSLYYLILYFCALEIIPVVLLIKLFLFYINNGIKSL